MKFIQWFNQLANLYKNLFVFGSSFGIGLFSLIPAYFTTWVTNHAPISYIVVFAAATITVAFLYFLFSLTLFYWEKSNYFAKISAPKSEINPLDKNFQNKRIFLKDFEHPFSYEIKDKDFIDCEIIGPAIITPVNWSQFDECGFDVCDAAIMRQGARVNNILVFNNCKFIRCKFFKVTLYFPKEAKDTVEKGMISKEGVQSSINWITET